MTDDEVTTLMDYLGRRQPVGQPKLSLSSATGGGPSGGPVTPPGSAPGAARVTSAPGSPAGPNTDLLTASEALGGARLAGNLASRFAGRFTGLAPITVTPGMFEPGGQATYGAQVGGQEGAQGLRTVGLPPSEGVPTAAAEKAAQGATEAGTEASGVSSGLGKALGVAGVVASTGLGLYGDITNKNLTDEQKALASAVTVGEGVLGAFSGGAIPVIDQLVQLFGGPSLTSFLGDVLGIGPSKQWATFPGRLGTGLQSLHGSIDEAARGIIQAKSPQDLQKAVEAYNQASSHGQNSAIPPSVGPTAIPGTPYTLNPAAEWAASLSGSKAHGAKIGDLSGFSKAEQALRGLIAQQHQRLTTPPPSAEAPAPPPPVMPGGPAGALGFSRDVLQAA